MCVIKENKERKPLFSTKYVNFHYRKEKCFEDYHEGEKVDTYQFYCFNDLKNIYILPTIYCITNIIKST